ncbi:hypothetical protein EK21DRAFT_67646 [Setomelanomma holmii]|uniref:RNA polymerase II assembly factor Rtp1 C-terminal domain-containing protein n=1 Tax=Setomelanomma holmii TaxID=210430 RepID=A0A9P4LL23_9PLEO|nr:hypothetical protein EK21DRAFT_67646 [Setomelanomma holmii]
MGAVEDAVDAAASFVGPFVDASRKEDGKPDDDVDVFQLVNETLAHLRSINTADLAADPDAPYDASLAGVVYGLLDFVTSYGILPYLSAGLAFSHRPRSVLRTSIESSSSGSKDVLTNVIDTLLPILEQKGSGIQPLLSQRTLPDVVSALAELSFSPTSQESSANFEPIYEKCIADTPTSRLLPLLTTFLQQPLPGWLRPVIAKELAIIPLRQHGVRHTIEFLSLSYLSKNSRVPEDASGSQSQIPIPLEAVTHASRLLVLPPTGIVQEVWLRELAPQLWALLDGREGKELSRAAGQIIAGGILSKKATGAPGTIGWELFAQPLLQAISPGDKIEQLNSQISFERALVQESELKRSLKRLSAIAMAYSHAGLLRRLIGPLLLPLWALFAFAHSRPALEKEWGSLLKTILSRYLSLACDPRQVDRIAADIFWDGGASWTFGPGSEGGVEIRRRSTEAVPEPKELTLLSRFEDVGWRAELLVRLLADAKISDGTASSIFLQTTKRWLSPPKDSKISLTDDDEIDPLAALTNARLVQAMATTFENHLARSPEHIIELMRQILSNFVTEHQNTVQKLANKHMSTRANLQHIVRSTETGYESSNSSSEEIVSFAISILKTLVSSPGFEQTTKTRLSLASNIPSLVYLTQDHSQQPISLLARNSAKTLLHSLQPSATPSQTSQSDPVAKQRAELKVVLSDLTSAEPPNRTWAINTLQKLIQDTAAFPAIDVPSLTHLLLSASLADPESYVHTAAVPVLVDLAVRAPSLVVRILVDSFIDIDERSFNLGRGRETEETERELQQALDFRLRIGEVLHNFNLDDTFWLHLSDVRSRQTCLKHITEACLSLASRRGQRRETHAKRAQLAQKEQRMQEEAEAAWGGLIPSLMDSDRDDSSDQAERDALVKIVQGWENTGHEEDVRIRACALTVLSTLFEHRLGLLRQAAVDAALQMALLILTMETSEIKGILRRSAVLLVMGLLRGLDSALEASEETTAGLGMSQGEQVERVLGWARNEDVDALVRDHAASVLEGIETLRLKRLYKIKDDGLRVGSDFTLEGNLRGLNVQPDLLEKWKGRKKLVLEEVD